MIPRRFRIAGLFAVQFILAFPVLVLVGLVELLERLARLVAWPAEWLCDAVDWSIKRREALGAVAPGPAVAAFLAAHPGDPASWSPAYFELYLDAQAADVLSGAVPRPDNTPKGVR